MQDIAKDGSGAFIGALSSMHPGTQALIIALCFAVAAEGFTIWLLFKALREERELARLDGASYRDSIEQTNIVLAVIKERMSENTSVLGIVRDRLHR